MADTAALVVALSAQLTKFEKDMKQAVDIADRHTKQIETTFTRMNKNIESQLSSFAQGAVSRLGPIGGILGALGPVGLTVAAAFATLGAALVFVTEKVNKFAEEARALKDLAETTGIATEGLQALNIAGQTVGLTFEQTERFITKLAVGVQELRSKGSGPLFDVLVKINPELVRQVAAAKDVTEAINILSAAYRTLTDAQQLQLSSAIGGRRNVTGGRVLGALPETGLTGAAQAEIGKGFDPALIERVAKVRQEIEAINKLADKIWGRAFAEDVLAAQKRAAELWLAIADAVEKVYSFARQKPPEPPPVEDRIAGIQQEIEALNKLDETRLKLNPRADIAFKETRIKLEKQLAEALEERRQKEEAANRAQEEAAKLPLPQPRPTPPVDQTAVLTNELELMKRWTSVLGDAITQQEALRQKKLELRVAALQDTDVARVETRALADFILKQREAAEAIRERLGVATQQSIEEAKLARLAADTAKFGLTENEQLKAKVIIMKEARDAADAMAVRQAYFPGLKQLEIDAQRVDKAFDQLAVRTFDTLGDGFADIVLKTKSVSEAFKSMTDSILRDLLRLIAKQTVFGPLSGVLQGLFSPGASLSGIGNAGWTAPLSAGAFLQGGGSVSSGQPYIVGEHGAELFVPQSAGQIVPGSIQRGGGGTSVEINNYVAADTETKQTTQQGPDGERIIIDIVKKAQARGELDNVNRSRFAMRPAKVR